MEMQEIPTESPRVHAEDGAGEPMLEVITKEEAEPDHYEQLKCPTEDVYVKASDIHPIVKSKEVSRARSRRRKEQTSCLTYRSKVFPMYIKFWRSYFKDEKEKPDEGSLSVELEGEKGKQAERNAGLYRLPCLILSVVCLILLILVCILGVKLQNTTTVCPGNGRSEDQQCPDPACSIEECQDRYQNIPFKHFGCQQCATGWLTYGRSCFFLSTTRLTWLESQKNCSASGGSLAIVTNKNVQKFLTQKGNLKYWIGLRLHNATWNWVNSNALQQSYWMDPVQNEDCAYLYSDGPVEKNWGRASCLASAYFICQLQF
ncbi:C-type lectin domain family 4 member C [Cyprinodon tularosa]|uniref:C-type lectin domain family 4 member C n=1 Tax=Cyprinodon tularosa TaxID=77115 RepID=UPI0018E26E00|nr:C-type lectin domain family 4 member C [Cyprinodon tularosa]